MGDTAAQANDGLVVTTEDRAGRLRLNRPGAGNRITSEMRGGLARGLEQFARDPNIYCAILEAAGNGPFCLGAEAGLRPDRETLSAAAWGIWQVDRFSKPHVALLAGAVTGAGLAVTLPGTHKVASNGVTLSGGGFEVSSLLAPLSGHVGLYMALTGRSIDRSLAYRLGLLTHCIEAVHFPAITARLADADPVDQVLDKLHTEPWPSPLEPHLPVIARCFAAASADAIVSRLDAERGMSAGWAQETAATLRAASLLDLAVMHRLLTLQTTLLLRDRLALAFRVALNSRTARSVDDHFLLLADGELSLPPEQRPPSIS